MNGTKGGCAWLECVGGGLRVGRGIILCSKAMVLDMTLLPLGKMSISLEFHFWPETPKKSKMAEMSMFCTDGLGHFGLRGRILRGKRPHDQQAACRVRQGKRAPPPGALCGVLDTLRPNSLPVPRRRHSGIARGKPMAARRRRAMRSCTWMQ